LRLRLRWWRLCRLDRFDMFDEARPDLRSELFREVLEANSLGDFVGHGVGRHTYIYALATSVLHHLLVVEL
jgi:hypothetical protein